MAFEPTHVVPKGGVPAWSRPDGSVPPSTELAPGTEVQAGEQRDEWVHVTAENGWTGWVDAGRIVERSSPLAGAPGTLPPVLDVAPAVSLPAGVELSSVGKRLGGYLLEAVLVFVTLIIGWLIWALILWARGQTPAKQILGMRVFHLDTGRRATWGRMFLREIVGKFVIGIVAAVTLIGMVLYLWLLWDQKRQQLWDKIAGTVVVDDPQGVLMAA